MKLLDIRDRLIQMDLDLARSYQASDTIKELLERLSTTILELQSENKSLRDFCGLPDNWWQSK